MIHRLRIQNYKALRDVTLEFTRLHVLIGPNDSGKTSILEAVSALCRSVDHPLNQAFTGSWTGHQLVWQGKPDLLITLGAHIQHNATAKIPAVYFYSIQCSSAANNRNMRMEDEYVDIESKVSLTQKGADRTRVCGVAADGWTETESVKEIARHVSDSLRGVQAYRWDGRFLALPVAPDATRRFRMEPSGFGLALLLDDILGFDRDRFNRLEDRFQKIFPEIQLIQLLPELAFKSPVDDPEQIPMLQRSDGKGLYFKFANNEQSIPARQVSDGVLLVLAYLAILHLPEPPRVLLIEEPENGIHPNRLKSVLTILRDLIAEQSETQVVLTTHSPYVVDLFEPEEVTLCQKDSDGSVYVRRLSDSKAVQEQMDVFTLGEIWTAEGDNALSQPTS